MGGWVGWPSWVGLALGLSGTSCGPRAVLFAPSSDTACARSLAHQITHCCCPLDLQ